MEIKLIHIKPVMVGAMTASSVFRGEVDSAPVPFELASCVCLDRKSSMRQWTRPTELTRTVTEHSPAFFLDVSRQVYKLIFARTSRPSGIFYVIVKLLPSGHRSDSSSGMLARQSSDLMASSSCVFCQKIGTRRLLSVAIMKLIALSNPTVARLR